MTVSAARLERMRNEMIDDYTRDIVNRGTKARRMVDRSPYPICGDTLLRFRKGVLTRDKDKGKVEA